MRLTSFTPILFLLCSLSAAGQKRGAIERTDTTVVYNQSFVIGSKIVGRYTINDGERNFVYLFDSTGKVTRNKPDCSGNCPDEAGTYTTDDDGVILMKLDGEPERYLFYQSLTYYFLVEESKQEGFEKEVIAENEKSMNGKTHFAAFVSATLTKKYLSRKMD